MSTDTRVAWVPLESNPAVMSEYIQRLGVSPPFGFVDIFGLDDDLLAMVPTPVLAVILLFPVTTMHDEHNKATLESSAGSDSADGPVFMRQTIRNACGAMAVLHAVANAQSKLDVEQNSPLAKFLNDIKDMTPVQRAERLLSDASIASVHARSAYDGQTLPPDAEDEVDFHFVCFVEKNDKLFELDGRFDKPIDHGKIEGGNDENGSGLLKAAAKIAKQYMQRDPDNLNFTLTALAPQTEW
ncbi:ubiquitin carboxyl-terminal esterase L3 [Ramicandelaber brevisporus]|nr:ubiquitin carboxyl-terminal esterase L3 [Ramicandelaber brevisporus]